MTCPKCGIPNGSHSHTCPIGGDPEYRVFRMLCSTAGLRKGDQVTVQMTMGPILTILDSNGVQHWVLEGDLVP